MRGADDEPHWLVLKFGRAWERRDIEGVLSLLDPAIEYQNVPAAILRGRDEVRAFIAPSLNAATEVVWEFLTVATSPDGRQVLTERIDTFTFPEGSATAPLMGIFEIENGLIRRWRDYTDLGGFARQMAAIGRALNPGLRVGPASPRTFHAW